MHSLTGLLWLLLYCLFCIRLLCWELVLSQERCHFLTRPCLEYLNTFKSLSRSASQFLPSTPLTLLPSVHSPYISLWISSHSPERLQSQLDSQDSPLPRTAPPLPASSSVSKRTYTACPVMAPSESVAGLQLFPTGCTPVLSLPLILDCNFSLCPQHWKLPLPSTLFCFFPHGNYNLMEYFLLFFFLNTRSQSSQADFLASNSQVLVLQVCTLWLFMSVSSVLGIESRA